MGWSLRPPLTLPCRPPSVVAATEGRVQERVQEKGLTMALSVRDPFAVDCTVLNREMGRDAVAQVFQNAIVAVWHAGRTLVALLPLTRPRTSATLSRGSERAGDGGFGFVLP